MDHNPLFNTSVAQLRLTGDAETVAALAVALNTARIEGVQFALQPSRPGQKGDEHLAYGTARLVAPEQAQADADDAEQLTQQLDLVRRRMEKMKASIARIKHAREDAEKLLGSGRGGMLRRPAQQLLAALNEVEKELL
jgi:uncharacterized membrane protein YccC